MATGRIDAVEALIRWRHPECGLIALDQFIELAEQTGQISALTEWVLEEAVRQSHAWEAAHGIVLPVAINVSASTLHEEAFIEALGARLAAHGLPPWRLRLEVTESKRLLETERTQLVFRRLSALGVHVSIDDYGTGYSSLSYLKRLPVSELKIDQSFIRQMGESEFDAVIVASTIGLGHSLGIRVVAEGVETEEALRTLTDLGCDVAQGYFISRPLTPDALISWLRGGSSPWPP